MATIGRCDENQVQCIASGTSGPSNIAIQDWEAARTSLETAINTAAKHASRSIDSLRAVHVGVAGFHSSPHQEALKHWVTNRFPAAITSVCSDIELVLAAGQRHFKLQDTCDVVGVIAGTGSAAFSLDKHATLIKAGGWGPVLGDEGSAYAIGLAALRSACEFDDGDDCSDPMVSHLLHQTGVCNPRDWPHWCQTQNNPRVEIAKLASPIIELADAGDSAAAESVVDAASASLAQQISRVALRLSCSEFYLAMSGGALIHHPTYQQRVLEKLQIHTATIRGHTIVEEPVLGALALACSLLK